MIIDSIKYIEHKSTNRQWVLLPLKFGKINLIVGKNSSGKSRLLNIIANSALTISGGKDGVFTNGMPTFRLSNQKRIIDYYFDAQGGNVAREEFRVNGKSILKRNSIGKTYVYLDKAKSNVVFHTDAKTLAINSKTDMFQTPVAYEFVQWAKSLKHYIFSSDMGKGNLLSLQTLQDGKAAAKNPDKLHLGQVVLEMKKPDCTKLMAQVIKDMEYIGYPITDFGIAPSERVGTVPPVFEVHVQEKDLKCKTGQIDMSLGMFRAFTTIVNINWLKHRKIGGCVLIDDIGEGLDFERSTKLIELLIEKVLDSDVQLIMATNDRFVMNKIDLEYWTILSRVGSLVRGINKSSAFKIFNDFEFMGLNNFDFFQRGLYLGEK